MLTYHRKHTEDKDQVALRGATLDAAGRCVAAAATGQMATGITLHADDRGQLAFEIAGLGWRATDPAIVAAGTMARSLQEDPFDVEQIAAIAAIMLKLKNEAFPVLAAAIALIARERAVVEELAEALIARKRLDAAELQQALRSVEVRQ
jgi:hypothetical protein